MSHPLHPPRLPSCFLSLPWWCPRLVLELWRGSWPALGRRPATLSYYFLPATHWAYARVSPRPPLRAQDRSPFCFARGRLSHGPLALPLFACPRRPPLCPPSVVLGDTLTLLSTPRSSLLAPQSPDPPLFTSPPPPDRRASPPPRLVFCLPLCSPPGSFTLNCCELPTMWKCCTYS